MERARITGLWLALLAGTGILAGLSSSLFLQGLERIGTFFASHPRMALALPVLGLVSSLLYARFGGLSSKGNNLLLEEINAPSRPVPWQMAPLVLVGTFLTHLGGGSAGREGTAVQMGGSLADTWGRVLRIPASMRPTLLRMGVAAGFAAVFGTPLAGALFGIEVSRTGRLALGSLPACLLSALLADRICLFTGAHHTSYAISAWPHLTPLTFGSLALAGILFGLGARLYSRTAHGLARLAARLLPSPHLRIAVGGALFAAFLLIVPGALRYAGLGVPLIVSSFHEPLLPWDSLAKGLATAFTLGVGFKGGEVTPLFAVGSTLGNLLSQLLPLPMPFLAGMGFVALFGACANTPLAAAVMAAELFGPAALPWALGPCLLAFSVSGHPGIYTSQGRTFDKF